MSEIQSAVQWLTRLVADEARYLHKVEGIVKELRNEFFWMQCFLRDIDENHSNDILSRRWIAQFREFSNEIEVTIETIRIVKDISNRGRQGNIFNRIKKYSKFVMYLRLLHRIGSDIKALKRKISLLTSKINTYGIELRKAESSSSWLLRPRYKFKNPVEDEIIGRDESMTTVVNVLLSKECRVVFICGKGGIGKTFMAEKVYHHEEIRKHFDAFAWAYVSQPCRNTTIYSELLSCLSTKSKEYIIQLTDSELKNELHKVLRFSKCLVVLDGLWAKEVWDSLQKSFPKLSPDIESKLLITNRHEDVARHVHPSVHVCRLDRLDDDHSMLLLRTKLEDVLPPLIFELDDAVKLLKKMLDYCEGFPLAITVLAGVLATKKIEEEWKKVLDYINSMVVDDDKFKWGRILELSYYDLPYQLKPCFLYMGYFLKNLQIPVKKIIRLWEAEALVSSEISKGVAEKCLSELVERSLVQVVTRDGLGKPKTCILHDLISGLCMAKASQENWLSIVPLGGNNDDQDDQLSGMFTNHQRVGASSTHLESPILEETRIRRLAIYYIKNNSEKLPFRHLRYIRSMLFFNTLSNRDILAPLKRYLKSAFDHWTLLRVLHVENIEVNSFPKEVGNLIYLRYLSLRGSWISKLPSTIQNLRSLQFLDLRVLSFVVVRIPDVLCRLEHLLHLYLPSKSFILRHNAKYLRLQGLYKLETLSNFNNKCRAEDVASLNNLRRVSTSDFLSNAKSIEPLVGSDLEHLEHVSLCLEGNILQEKPDTLARCYKLQKLWVKGKVNQSITSVKFADNLTRLSFQNTEFQDDPMEVLGKLPSLLKKLSLKHASYTGTNMTCSFDSFKELKYLTLKGLKGLEVWTVENEAMPKLSLLKINSCQKLKMLPFIKNLKELVFSFMPYSFFERNNPNDLTKWSQYSKVEHVPRINVSYVLDLEDD